MATREWGADMLELDVRTSRDGVVMVIHDETVDRTTDGTGRVSDLTFRELRQLDAGFRFRDPGGEPTYRGAGVRIPTFEEVLESVPGCRLNVEAKDGTSAVPLAEIILRHGAENRVLVAAEWERNRKKIRWYPGPWGASRRQITAFLLLSSTPLSFLYTPACDALQVPEYHRGIRVLTPRFLREAHRRNIPVHVWTVDDPGDMRRLLAMGVDAVQTDRPDLLAPILTEMFGRPPAPCLARSGLDSGE